MTTRTEVEQQISRARATKAVALIRANNSISLIEKQSWLDEVARVDILLQELYYRLTLLKGE